MKYGQIEALQNILLTGELQDSAGANGVTVAQLKTVYDANHSHGNKALLDTYTQLEADIADAHGGGLVNIVSVIYQILVLSLVKPRQRRVLFLDEPFRNVSEEYLEATAEFVRQLNEKLGIQIVLITHRKQLADIADKAYEFSLENGITKVSQLGER